jgi:uncharacterized protein (TIGR00375 family)
MSMKFTADFHIHSRFSRATSRELNFVSIAKWAMLKGITVVGTGDFTHPAWMAEIRENLEHAEPGLLKLKTSLKDHAVRDVPAGLVNDIRFLLTVEISNIYKRHERVRKVHNIVFMPDLDSADILIQKLSKIGNLKSDGRPILGLDSRDLLEIVLSCSDQAFLVPAHIWTPWFSMFGAQSGFDSMIECFGDLSPHIFAIETGLSSDPSMNWRLSQLDRMTIISNSDAHSPENLGREANIFDTDFSYEGILKALKNPQSKDSRFLGTIEFFPEEGKYHFDGHRKCSIRLHPSEACKLNLMCPECGKKVTVGVMHRVMELADRSEGIRPDGKASFQMLVPLKNIIGETFNVGAGSSSVDQKYHKLIKSMGSEFFILKDAPIELIQRQGSEIIAEAINRMRQGKIQIAAGYDGEYGRINIFSDEERSRFGRQISFFRKSETERPKPERNTQSRFGFPEHGLIEKKQQDLLAGGQSSPLQEKNEHDADSLLKDLNEQQREAVLHEGSPLLIIAGPGTGKTKTLTTRIAYRIMKGYVLPQFCLAITFSNRAANEMKERLEFILGKDISCKINVCTFHAFGLSVLKRFHYLADLPAAFTVLGEQESFDLLKKSAATAGFDISQKKIQSLFSESRRKSEHIEEQYDDSIDKIFTIYRDLKKKNGFVDFNDLLSIPLQIFKENPDARKDMTQTLFSLSIDEYQDINSLQHEIILMLAENCPDLFAIGDYNQSIYGFRGSDPAFFTKFTEDFPSTRLINLKKNYRSSIPIIKASNQVIEEIHAPLDQACEVPEIKEPLISIYEASSPEAEAEFVVHSIEKLMGGTGWFSFDSGRVSQTGQSSLISFSDIAVLVRLFALMDPLKEAFERSGMPFQMIRENSVFSERQFKIILTFLKAAVNPIGDYYLTELEKTCSFDDKNFLIRKIIGELGKEIEENRRPSDILNSLYENLHAKKFKIKGTDLVFSAEDPLLKKFSSEFYGNDLRSAVDRIALHSSPDDFDPRSECITMMTMHASKGLEFKAVFVIGCEHGIIPYLRDDEPETKKEEEQRLFYVAITRAKEFLFLTGSRKRTLFGRISEPDPSPFLLRIEDELKNRIRQQYAKKIKKDSQMDLF